MAVSLHDVLVDPRKCIPDVESTMGFKRSVAETIEASPRAGTVNERNATRCCELSWAEMRGLEPKLLVGEVETT